MVFVGFGSEYKMPIEQVHEMAYGVELSELPFIWILRKPGVSSSELLPDGFWLESLTEARFILVGHHNLKFWLNLLLEVVFSTPTLDGALSMSHPVLDMPKFSCPWCLTKV